MIKLTPRDKTPRPRTNTRPIDAPQTLIGRVLDERYRLDSVLNTGGMGIVFEATQLPVNRTVAVKILKPSLSTNPLLIKRFRQEVDVIASICHPNIVGLIDSGHDSSGLQYLVMEYVDGKTLREALQGSRLTLVDILNIFAQTCTALIATHDQGIVHRDLKFENIMVMRQPDRRIHVKLLDFGVAKLLARNLDLTQTGQVTGTPGIIAPELIDEEPATPRSDMYSLGVLLYTALTGEAPFKGDNHLELMHAHKNLNLPNLKALIGDFVPEEILDLTCELMEKNPEFRPDRAESVRDRLETIIKNLKPDYLDPKPYNPPRLDYTAIDIESKIANEKLMNTIVENLGEEALPAHMTQERKALKTPLFSDPIITPFTVISFLGITLISLLVVLVYMLYNLFIRGQA